MKRLILFITLVIFIIPVIIYANGRKSIEDPIDQTIIFDENSGISLLEETINYRFGDNLYEAKVGVEYILKNITDEVQSFNIMFITPNLKDADFSVKTNNRGIKDIKIDKDIEPPKNWGASLKYKIIEPISKKVLNKSSDSNIEMHAINGITFPVTIKPNESIKLNITYNSQSGFYRYQETINTVYSQLYYLTPAKFWEGNSKVNLRIEFPKDSNIELYSNIPMDKINNFTYVGTLDKTPDEEWLFTFTEKNGLIFNTNYRLKHNIIIISIIILLFIVIRLIKPRIKNKYIAYLLYLLMIPFILNIKLTYGALYIPLYIVYSIINSPLFYVVLIIIIGIKITKAYSSKNRL